MGQPKGKNTQKREGEELRRKPNWAVAIDDFVHCERHGRGRGGVETPAAAAVIMREEERMGMGMECLLGCWSWLWPSIPIPASIPFCLFRLSAQHQWPRPAGQSASLPLLHSLSPIQTTNPQAIEPAGLHSSSSPPVVSSFLSPIFIFSFLPLVHSALHLVVSSPFPSIFLPLLFPPPSSIGWVRGVGRDSFLCLAFSSFPFKCACCPLPSFLPSLADSDYFCCQSWHPEDGWMNVWLNGGNGRNEEGRVDN